MRIESMRSSRPFRILAFAAVMVTATALLAAPGDTESGSNSKPANSDEPLTLPEVVVKPATRLSLNLFEQPYAIYRHDRLSLDSGIGRTALDRIDYGPGVIIQHTAPGQTSPYIRGLTGKQSLLEGQKGDTHVFLLLPPRTPRSS